MYPPNKELSIDNLVTQADPDSGELDDGKQLKNPLFTRVKILALLFCSLKGTLCFYMSYTFILSAVLRNRTYYTFRYSQQLQYNTFPILEILLATLFVEYVVHPLLIKELNLSPGIESIISCLLCLLLMVTLCCILKATGWRPAGCCSPLHREVDEDSGVADFWFYPKPVARDYRTPANLDRNSKLPWHYHLLELLILASPWLIMICVVKFQLISEVLVMLYKHNQISTTKVPTPLLALCWMVIFVLLICISIKVNNHLITKLADNNSIITHNKQSGPEPQTSASYCFISLVDKLLIAPSLISLAGVRYIEKNVISIAAPACNSKDVDSHLDNIASTFTDIKAILWTRDSTVGDSL